MVDLFNTEVFMLLFSDTHRIIENLMLATPVPVPGDAQTSFDVDFSHYKAPLFVARVRILGSKIILNNGAETLLANYIVNSKQFPSAVVPGSSPAVIGISVVEGINDIVINQISAAANKQTMNFSSSHDYSILTIVELYMLRLQLKNG